MADSQLQSSPGYVNLINRNSVFNQMSPSTIQMCGTASGGMDSPRSHCSPDPKNNIRDDLNLRINALSPEIRNPPQAGMIMRLGSRSVDPSSTAPSRPILPVVRQRPPVPLNSHFGIRTGHGGSRPASPSALSNGADSPTNSTCYHSASNSGTPAAANANRGALGSLNRTMSNKAALGLGHELFAEKLRAPINGMAPLSGTKTGEYSGAVDESKGQTRGLRRPSVNGEGSTGQTFVSRRRMRDAWSSSSSSSSSSPSSSSHGVDSTAQRGARMAYGSTGARGVSAESDTATVSSKVQGTGMGGIVQTAQTGHRRVPSSGDAPLPHAHFGGVSLVSRADTDQGGATLITRDRQAAAPQGASSAFLIPPPFKATLSTPSATSASPLSSAHTSPAPRQLINVLSGVSSPSSSGSPGARLLQRDHRPDVQDAPLQQYQQGSSSFVSPVPLDTRESNASHGSAGGIRRVGSLSSLRVRPSNSAVDMTTSDNITGREPVQRRLSTTASDAGTYTTNNNNGPSKQGYQSTHQPAFTSNNNQTQNTPLPRPPSHASSSAATQVPLPIPAQTQPQLSATVIKLPHRQTHNTSQHTLMNNFDNNTITDAPMPPRGSFAPSPSRAHLPLVSSPVRAIHSLPAPKPILIDSHTQCLSTITNSFATQTSESTLDAPPTPPTPLRDSRGTQCYPELSDAACDAMPMPAPVVVEREVFVEREAEESPFELKDIIRLCCQASALTTVAHLHRDAARRQMRMAFSSLRSHTTNTTPSPAFDAHTDLLFDYSATAQTAPRVVRRNLMPGGIVRGARADSDGEHAVVSALQPTDSLSTDDLPSPPEETAETRDQRVVVRGPPASTGYAYDPSHAHARGLVRRAAIDSSNSEGSHSPLSSEREGSPIEASRGRHQQAFDANEQNNYDDHDEDDHQDRAYNPPHTPVPLPLQVDTRQQLQQGQDDVNAWTPVPLAPPAKRSLWGTGGETDEEGSARTFVGGGDSELPTPVPLPMPDAPPAAAPFAPAVLRKVHPIGPSSSTQSAMPPPLKKIFNSEKHAHLIDHATAAHVDQTPPSFGGDLPFPASADGSPSRRLPTGTKLTARPPVRPDSECESEQQQCPIPQASFSVSVVSAGDAPPLQQSLDSAAGLSDGSKSAEHFDKSSTGTPSFPWSRSPARALDNAPDFGFGSSAPYGASLSVANVPKIKIQRPAEDGGFDPMTFRDMTQKDPEPDVTPLPPTRGGRVALSEFSSSFKSPISQSEPPKATPHQQVVVEEERKLTSLKDARRQRKEGGGDDSVTNKSKYSINPKQEAAQLAPSPPPAAPAPPAAKSSEELLMAVLSDVVGPDGRVDEKKLALLDADELERLEMVLRSYGTQ